MLELACAPCQFRVQAVQVRANLGQRDGGGVFDRRVDGGEAPGRQVEARHALRRDAARAEHAAGRGADDVRGSVFAQRFTEGAQLVIRRRKQHRQRGASATRGNLGRYRAGRALQVKAPDWLAAFGHARMTPVPSARRIAAQCREVFFPELAGAAWTAGRAV